MGQTSQPVVTVTLNPAIDLTAGSRGLRLGQVNRVSWQQEDPGGKGVNVASFLAWFGLDVTATGLLGRDNESAFRTLFAARGIEDDFVRMAGRTRTNIKLIDEEAGPAGVTDINFSGFAASPDDLAHLRTILDRLAARDCWVVLSGSLPAGVPEDIYRDLTEHLRERGARVFLDASGPSLSAGLTARPTAIKPNIHELGDWLGHPVDGLPEVCAAVDDLHGRGIETVIVSMGADGALFSDGRHKVVARPPDVPVRSTVGAGDAMVAGFVTGSLRGLPLADKARLATAFSVGALSQLGPRLPPPAEVERQVPNVRIEDIASA